jgi:hypothetical protein
MQKHAKNALIIYPFTQFALLAGAVLNLPLTPKAFFIIMGRIRLNHYWKQIIFSYFLIYLDIHIFKIFCMYP